MAYFTTKNQSEIYYQRSGKEGAQALLYIHGFTCDSSHWANQISFFENQPADYDIVAVDLGGHGKSKSDITFCNITQYADDLIALINKLGLNKPFLIGHSMGCRVSLCAASQMNDQLGGLALLDSGLLADEQNVEEALNRIDEVVAGMGFPAFAKVMFENMFFHNADPALKDSIVEQASSFDAELGLQLGKSLIRWEGFELSSVLEKIEIPILGVCTTETMPDFSRRPLSVDERDRWATLVLEKAPHAEIVNIPETGHFLMQERPEEVNSLLKEFFEEHTD